MLPFKHNIYDSAVLTVYNLFQFISKTCFDTSVHNNKLSISFSHQSHTSSGAPCWWRSSTTCLNPMTDFIFTEPKNLWNREDNNLAQTVLFKEVMSRGFCYFRSILCWRHYFVRLPIKRFSCRVKYKISPTLHQGALINHNILVIFADFVL